MSKFEIPWQTLIDSAPDGWCVLDADGAVRYANAAALSLLGLPSPDGTTVSDWLAGLGETSRDLLLRTWEQGGQVRLHLPHAEHKHLVFEAEQLTGGEGMLGRVRRDYEVEASETIAITVHELRIPMTSILGYAKMLLTTGGESLSDAQRQFLNTINRNVERLNRDLAAVQDMTRVDRAKVRLTRGPQFPARVAAQVLDELRPLVQEKGHHVTLDFPEGLPPVQADAERLEQILRILLDNALKYTPPNGQIRLQGRVAGDGVQIDVIDNGLGIPAAEQDRVFSKFFRGEAEQIRAYPGLGLNLHIARGLVTLQGGQLRFSSTPGQGSTFSFTLPA